jgi:hypothetical protein
MKNFVNRVRQVIRSRSRRLRNGRYTFRPACEQLETRLVPSLVPASSPIDVTSGVGGQKGDTHRTAAEAADGQYRVDWEDKTLGIYTRLFGFDGTPLANPVQIPGTGVADSEVTVAMNAGHMSAIAWTHSTGQTTLVLVQRVNAAGALVGAPIPVSSAYPGGSARQPSLAMDAAGVIALAYTDSVPGGAANVFASNQVKGILFPAKGPATPLAVTASKATSQPNVAMNATGSFVVAFTQDAGRSNQDVYVQRFQAGGTPQGGAITPPTMLRNR